MSAPSHLLYQHHPRKCAKFNSLPFCNCTKKTKRDEILSDLIQKEEEFEQMLKMSLAILMKAEREEHNR
ncbi:MAG: hypothetical protein RR356_05265 [Bacteroidales bacterium]